MKFMDRIRRFISRDKTVQSTSHGRGYPYDDPTSGAIDNVTVTGSGVRSLSAALSMDQHLMQRYADYENMDDYPELCLSGESMIFTLRKGWVSIRDLAKMGESFHVISYDKDLRSLVPAEAHSARLTGKEGHGKRIVQVILDNGQTIKCTEDHLFMAKNEEWVAAKNLKPGQRLMPGCLRMRSLNIEADLSYWEVHQPNSDSVIRSSDGKRWTWVHRLVGDKFLGLKEHDIVYHVDSDSLNNDPENLSIEDTSSHAFHHIAGIDNTKYFPDWTDKKKVEMSARMKGNCFRLGKKDSKETRSRKSLAGKGRRKSKEWREKIGLSQPSRIDIPVERLEAALNDRGTVAGAARILGVSWSKVKRDIEKHDFLNVNANHRVVRVEYLESSEEVFDLTVPGYHNFVCNGVVVHNSAALDIYADDATIPHSVRGKTIWAESKDRVVRDVVDDLLHRRLRIEEDIWLAVRTLCKYGNCTAEIVTSDVGVVGLNFLPVPTIRRLTTPKGELVGYVQDLTGSFNIDLKDYKKISDLKNKFKEKGMVFFEPWEIVHWRLQSKFVRSLYGYSILDAARWIWKRLAMLEDTALVYKLTRSPGRYAFYVDTGDMPPQEAMAYVNKVRRKYKKRTLINPTTGQMEFRNNPLSPEDDMWIPTRGGKESTRVEVMAGPDWQCLTGDTPIPLLDGTTLTIAELSDRNSDVWLYAMNEKGEVVPGKGHSARKTKKAEVWEIELDNGQIVRCSDNHPFMLRDGTWLRADQLVQGCSLMPLYSEVSSFESGDRLDGYEKVFDPAEGKFIYTHQMVHRWRTGSLLPRNGHVIHHAGTDKLDNRPDFLKEMSRSEHSKLHLSLVDHLHSDRVKKAAAEAKKTSEFRRKMRLSWTTERRNELSARNANASEEMRAAASARISKWNGSKEHREFLLANHPRKRDVELEELASVANENGVQSLKEMYALGYSQNLIYRILGEAGIGWCDFAKQNIEGWVPKGRAVAALNHKVVSVKRTGEEEWLYDLTVDDYHNFAIGQGIFVHNSMDDIEYFRDKMFTAIKIPRAYYGGDAEAEQGLAQKDVRFARTCMRVQREFRNGIRQIVRVHMASMNIDPDSIEWDTRMTVPSSIFELQQIEVMNAQAGLIDTLADHFPEEWLLERVFHVSKEEASSMMEWKANEDERKAVDAARVESDIAKKYPEAEVDKDNGGSQNENVDVAEEFAKLNKRIEETMKTSSRVLQRVKEIEPKVDRHVRKLNGSMSTALRQVQ